MKLTLSSRWTQNVVFLLLAGALVGATVFFQDPVKAAANEELFFWLVLGSVVLLGVLLYLLNIIELRARALSNSRTQDLLETQKLFVELYRNSPVPYVMVDHAGAVTYPNHAATRLFGLEEETFAGKNIFDLFSVIENNQIDKPELIFARFKGGVFVENRDILVRRTDGATRYCLLSIFPYGEFGDRKKGLMTLVDITKQKKIEQAKSEFVSLASHQLRTPISSIRWNLELLQSPQLGELSEEQQNYFTKIITATTKMNTIVEDFLSVSQLELDAKEVISEQIDLPELFSSIEEEFEGRIEEKALTFTSNIDERLTTIETDKRLLHMIISNLVSNATKYTPEAGAVRLHYTATGDRVTITVSDSGVGIPIDDQEQLFSKFYRASNVRNEKVQGTGLGLYIVKLAVEKLGGTITFESKMNEGTVFAITIPVTNAGRMG